MTTELIDFHEDPEYDENGKATINENLSNITFDYRYYRSNDYTGLNYEIKGIHGTYDGAGYILPLGNKDVTTDRVEAKSYAQLSSAKNMFFNNGTIAVEFLLSGTFFY